MMREIAREYLVILFLELRERINISLITRFPLYWSSSYSSEISLEPFMNYLEMLIFSSVIAYLEAILSMNLTLRFFSLSFEITSSVIWSYLTC